MFEWLLSNKEWVFSGAGIALISFVAWLFRSKGVKANNTNQSVNGISAGGNVNVEQNIVGGDVISLSLSSSAETKKKKRGLFAKLGVKCFSLANPPPDKSLLLSVRESLIDAATDLDIVRSGETLPESNEELVDLIGRRIHAREGDQAYGAFMLGCLGPSIIEHRSNIKYRQDIEKFCYQAHGKELSAVDKNALWSSSNVGIPNMYNVIINLAEDGKFSTSNP